jgi:predicted SPOUT superfamily RNA methylase MTH1
MRNWAYEARDRNGQALAVTQIGRTCTLLRVLSIVVIRFKGEKRRQNERNGHGETKISGQRKAGANVLQ